MPEATSSRSGDSQTIESNLLMHRVLRQDTSTLRGNPVALLSADVTGVIESEDAQAQSSPYAPILVSKHLNDTHGDTVKVDQLGELTGMAVMGDRKAKGMEEGISRSQMSVRIDQTRKPVFVKSRMGQQRRGYDLTRASEKALDSWYKRIQSEKAFSHMMGARGSFAGRDLILRPEEPLFTADGQPLNELSEQYTNDLMPPTADRRFFAGAATSISHTANPIQATDTLSMADLRRVAVAMQEMDYPLQAASLAGADNKVGMDPMYFGFLTAPMYDDALESDPDYKNYQANAIARTKGYDHPLFRNECFMIENTLFFKYFRPCRFYSGDSVWYSNTDRLASRAEDQVPANVEQVDRGIIIGAQALIQAYAGDTNGAVFQTNEDMDDYDDKEGICLRFMEGTKKARQYTNDGYAYDTGIVTIDAATTPRV